MFFRVIADSFVFGIDWYIIQGKICFLLPMECKMTALVIDKSNVSSSH